MSQLPRELFALVLAYASPITLTRLASIKRYNSAIGRELERQHYTFEQRHHSDDRYRSVDGQDLIQSIVEYHGDLAIDSQGAIIILLDTIRILPQSVAELELKRLIYHNYSSGDYEYFDCLDLVYIDYHDRLWLFQLYRGNESDLYNEYKKIILHNVQDATVSLAKNNNNAFVKRYLIFTKDGSLVYLDLDGKVRRTLSVTLKVCALRILTLGPLQLVALFDDQHTLHIYTWPDLVLVKKIPNVLVLVNHWKSFVYLTPDNKMHRWNKFGIATYDNDEVIIPFLQGHLFLRTEGTDIIAFTPCQLLEEHTNKYRCVNLRFKK